ncbi:MAG: OPT/YSL family transporter [Thermoanaerobaculia bacterium]
MTEPPAEPRGASIRALLVGLALAVVIAAYSAYAGLKVGGVYWPIITATLLAMALLKPLGAASPQEVNVAATAASTGGLLAAGVVFTLPAGQLLGVVLSPHEVSLVATVGGLLGVLFTLPLREEMLERLALPYPDGAATAQVIAAGDAGGTQVRRMLGAFGVGGAFAAVRDGLGWLPPVVAVKGQASGRWLTLGSSVSLVPLAGGFLIGPRFTGLWFAGAALSYFGVVPALVLSGRFAAKGEAIAAITRPAGIGVIVGASLAYFLVHGLPRLAPLAARLLPRGGRPWQRFGPLAAVAAGILATSVVLQLPLAVALVAVAAGLAVAYMAARIAGELNIDPMEIFAIAILLILLFFVELPARSAVLLAALLCLAAGMAGDFMQDLKAGSLVGTRPRDQALAQLISVPVSAAVLGVVLAALTQRFQVGSPELPAPQAVALAAIVARHSIGGPLAWGGLAGAVAALLSLRANLGIAPIAFGIGVYAPLELSLPLFAGGLLRLAAERRGSGDHGRLLAAGVLGGEGLVGVVLALWAYWR